ncbi:hypothetical protein [Limnobacter sp.]|uniref:hypothetical protein n=1 Tax=Limnobacter sp. TaxID=2003368 RepID=UPI0025841DF8|nr:hypothetical protein [Limnobacter sp.]
MHNPLMWMPDRMSVLMKAVKTGVWSALLGLTACVNTHVTLDMREPNHSSATVLADLSQQTIDLLTLQNPALIHGTLDDRAKQLGICEAFFEAHPRVQNVLDNSGPVKIDGLTVTKQVKYRNGSLSCGFVAEGKAAQVLQALQGTSIINADLDQHRIHVVIDTNDTSWMDMPDTNLLGALDSAIDSQHPPALTVTILGNDLKSDYTAGEKGLNQFKIVENMQGRRLLPQSRFNVWVSAKPATLWQKAEIWLGDLADALEKFWQRLMHVY